MPKACSVYDNDSYTKDKKSERRYSHHQGWREEGSVVSFKVFTNLKKDCELQGWDLNPDRLTPGLR